MKFYHAVSILILSAICFYPSINAGLAFERRGSVTGQQIAQTFNSISQTITSLKNAQASSPATGTPDFQKVTNGLGYLAQLAEKGYEQLNNLQYPALDNDATISVKGALATSANDVTSITTLVINNKNWFATNKVTEKVIQILQTNQAQFSILFTTLNQHVRNEFQQTFESYESDFICSITKAIATLQNSSATCKDFSDSLDKGPTGFQSCSNSATTWLKNAYSQQTLGTKTTDCSTSTKMKANSFFMPKNALLL